MKFTKVEQAALPCNENIFIQVAGIINGSPAAKAGLKEDDIILSLNGEPTCNDAENIIPTFKNRIERQLIGASVTLDILRGDQKLALPVPLEAVPYHEQREAQHPEIEQCPERTSRLESVLHARNTLPLYENILRELYRKSNQVHNPGSAAEEHSHPLQLDEVTYLMRHPLAAGEVAGELTRRVVGPFDEKNWRLDEVMQKTASLLDRELSVAQKPDEITFPVLLKLMEKTKNKIDEALSNLTSEEKTLLLTTSRDLMDDSQWNKILDVSLKMDRARLFNSFSPLLAFLSKDNLTLLKKDLITRFGTNKGPILYEAVTPMGKVIVGGPGPNVYTEDAALILDIGGDDLYLNNAGGTRPGMGVALLIDWGGNDRYISKEYFSQGAGFLGLGILLDLGGDDAFISLDGSQGAGFWGVGMLYHGNGNGIFNARRFSQGTGQMGIGLLFNRKGDDTYLCSYGGQGLGLFGGAGVLIDEAGNDLYQLGGAEADFRDPERSTQSFGQGFGLGVRSEKDNHGVPGGIGMLIDKEGDDVYLTDYFAQGASYYYSLGILDDRSGNDQYISGRYSQGAGIHSSVGVLIDRQGNDFYYSSFGVAQGMGYDFGIGFFEDVRGDDRYKGNTLVQGAATNGGIGVFIGNGEHSNSGSGGGYTGAENSMGILIQKGRTIDDAAVKLGIKF